MILAIGSVALDTIKTPFGRTNASLGGSGTYFAISASFFTRVSLIGVIGTDFPKKYIEKMRLRNIDLTGLQIKNGRTFRWSGEYSFDLNNPKTLLTELNVFSSFNPCIPSEFRNHPYLFLGNIDPSLQLNVLKQMNEPRLIACDTIRYWIEKKPKELRRVVKKADIFFLNDSEAREFSREHNLKKTARFILSLGPRYVIIKKGEHGVLLFSKNSTFATPAFLLEDIFDPTGAGDSFAGGFMGYIAQKKSFSESSMRQAIVYGTIMASYCVEGLGARALLSLKQNNITRRYNEFKRFTQY
ncbi:MAG: sugar kinase [Candidatus Omnitrophica bacterium]|nr:sugar kinase [Candidatus Omnitrophota bacterium]